MTFSDIEVYLQTGIWGLCKFEKEEKGLFGALKNIGKFLRSLLLISRQQTKQCFWTLKLIFKLRKT